MAKNDSGWRAKEPTEAQTEAIFNMRHALGLRANALHKIPPTRGDASDEITQLKETIENNISLGGSIDPRKSVYANNNDWGLNHEGE